MVAQKQESPSIPPDLDPVKVMEAYTTRRAASAKSKRLLITRYALEGFRIPNNLISHDGELFDPDLETQAAFSELLSGAMASPIIDMDDVAEALYPVWEREHSLTEAIQADKHPPMSRVWLEYEHPYGHRIGVLMCDTRKSENEKLRDWCRGRDIAVFGGCGWKGLQPRWPAFGASYDLDENGNLAQQEMLSGGGIRLLFGRSFRMATMPEANIPANLLIPWVGLGMLNCVNIELAEQPIGGDPKRLAKRMGESPPGGYKYNVLTIKPPKGKRRKDSPATVGESMGLVGRHFVRPHFKYFDEEHPLFGLFTGKFWWAAQWRGNASRGTILKDYRPAAPE